MGRRGIFNFHNKQVEPPLREANTDQFNVYLMLAVNMHLYSRFHCNNSEFILLGMGQSIGKTWSSKLSIGEFSHWPKRLPDRGHGATLEGRVDI